MIRTLVLLLIVWPASAQPRKVTGDHEVRPGGFASLRVEGAGRTVLWDVYPPPVQVEEIEGVLVFTGTAGTDYQATATVIDFDKKTVERLRHSVRFSGAPPPPTPPTPPTPPDPPPKPPEPPPTPTVNPFPGVTGLHLLIVYESAELQNYPRAQINSWQSKEVSDYLRSKGSDNWRRWDRDTDVSGAESKWKQAFARVPRSVELPWIAVGNGTSGYEGRAPATHAELMALLRKFGDK